MHGKKACSSLKTHLRCVIQLLAAVNGCVPQPIDDIAIDFSWPSCYPRLMSFVLDSREELAKFLSQGYNRCALVSKT